MNRKIIVFLAIMIMLFILPDCAFQESPAGVSQTAIAPLSWLLEFVPSTPGNQLAYNDILTLSAQYNIQVPSSFAYDDEVVEWWVTIENHFFVKSYVVPRYAWISGDLIPWD